MIYASEGCRINNYGSGMHLNGSPFIKEFVLENTYKCRLIYELTVLFVYSCIYLSIVNNISNEQEGTECV